MYVINSKCLITIIYYYQMTSIIKTLIQKYEHLIQNIQKKSSEHLKNQAKRCQTIAISFMNIISILCISDEAVARLNQKQIKIQSERILKIKSKQQNIDSNHLKYILGLFIQDKFSNDQELQTMKSQFELEYEEEFSQISEGQLLDDTLNIDQDQQDQTSFNQFLKELHQTATISSINQTFSSSFDSGVSLFGKKNTSNINIEQDNSHKGKITKYLSQLSSPQTELSYLCQHMGWRHGFKDTLNPNNTDFITTVEVQFQYKNIKKILTEFHSAKNKKTGKLFASFKMLRKIYISFPQIWDMFEVFKNQKSLNLAKDPQMSMLMGSIIIDEHVQQEVEKQEKNEEYEHQKKVYLQNIASFKSQINLLVQQNPGILNFKKMDKMQEGNQWRVKGELTVDFKNIKKEYKQLQKGGNSKNVEQIIAKKLVQHLFEDYHQILDKMIMIKKKKGIKT